MSTYRDLTTQIADQWVAALKSAEETVTKYGENAQKVADSLPRLPVAEPFAKLNESLTERLPDPKEVVEANFDFTTRLLSAQRDLTLRVIEANVAAVQSAPTVTKTAKTTKATNGS